MGNRIIIKLRAEILFMLKFYRLLSFTSHMLIYTLKKSKLLDNFII